MSRSTGHNPPGAGRVGGRLAATGHEPGGRRRPSSDSSDAPTAADDTAGMRKPSAHRADGMASALDCKVLVLNKMYMAVRVISARRAFTMLFRDLAEVVHVEDGQWMTYDFSTWAELSELRREFEAEQAHRHDWVSTVRFNLAVPRVIRLLGYDRLPQQHVKLNRRNLFARDRNRCQYCGNIFPTQELSLDHVVPKTQGGGESWENLVCSCVRCNARKGGRTPDQANMALIKTPTRPKRNPLITVKLGQQRYESWKTFLDDAYWSVELR